MAVKEKRKTRPNILNVSLRLLLIAVFSGGAYAIYRISGAENPPVISLVGIGALLLCTAVILIQLIVWGLIWVKNERVSELGMHIVRYAVTLTAISLCVFVLLSLDYGKLYAATHMNELKQNVISGSVFLQPAIGEGVEDDTQYFIQLGQSADSLLIDAEENADRFVCLYLKNDALSLGDSGFTSVEGGYIGLSTNDYIGCSANPEILDRVIERFSVEYQENVTVGTFNLTSVYSPVFSVNGEPVGVLGICEINQPGAGILRFANLELCLKLLALVSFFSFAFYGCMQLVDILLRPRQFDRSRRVLSCGRESARPILFFITLSASLPVMMLLFADNIRSLMDIYELPFGIGTYIPFIAYLVGIAIGQLFGRGNRKTLSEIPADAGLLFSFLCNLALCLFMDWKALSGLGLAENVIFVLVLVFICGLGYGIAYRITAKFQAQSDALFGYDKYVYLCSCLGAIAGIVFGGILIENFSNVTLRIISCIITAFTAVIAIFLLEDLKSTVEIDESSKDTLTSYAGGIAGIIPVGLACCYVWIYLAEYMFTNEISIAAIGFCSVMPIIAFCFGNRLRLKHRMAQRGSLIISAVLSAISFIPMALIPSFSMAVAASLIVSIAVIFAASGVYSTTRHGELKKLTFRAMPLLFIGIIAAVIANNVGNNMISQLVGAGLCLVFMLVFLVSKYPSRPIIESKLPAITAGPRMEKKAPVPAAPVITPQPEQKKKQEEKIPEEDKPAPKKQNEKKQENNNAETIPVIPLIEEKPEPEQNENEMAKEEKPEDKQQKKSKNDTEPEPAKEETAAESTSDNDPVIILPDTSESPVKTDENQNSDSNTAEQPAPADTAEEAKKEPVVSDAVEEDDPLPIIFIDDPQEPEQSNDSAPVNEPTTVTVENQAEKTPAEDSPAQEENDAAALEAARAEAAKRARERWQKYNQSQTDK